MHLCLESVLLIFLFLFLSTVSTAPVSTSDSTSPVDEATLLANGKAAQRLNAQFETLKATDPCADGQTACISNFIAQCTSGGWQLSTQCLETQQCFALPSLTSKMTTIACTSRKTAESLFKAVGATASNSTSNEDDPSPSNASGGDQPVCSMHETETNSGQKTVTVTSTVTAIPTHFIQTTTISPQEASQLLSSLQATAILMPHNDAAHYDHHDHGHHHHHHSCHMTATNAHDTDSAPAVTTPTAGNVVSATGTTY